MVKGTTVFRPARLLTIAAMVAASFAVAGQASAATTTHYRPNGVAPSSALTDPTYVTGSGWAFFHFTVTTSFDTTGPFTFRLTTPTTLKVTDLGCPGDQFAVYDNGTPLGDTSTPGVTTCTNPGVTSPTVAFTTPAFSSGTFHLTAGTHALTFEAITSPFGGGTGAFEVPRLCGSVPSTPTNLLTNGSFESGCFTGWTVTNGVATPTTSPFCPTLTSWQVLSSPSSAWCYAGTAWSKSVTTAPNIHSTKSLCKHLLCFTTSISAVDGTFFADTTWDGSAGTQRELSQVVSIPAATTDVLSWSDNANWALVFPTSVLYCTPSISTTCKTCTPTPPALTCAPTYHSLIQSRVEYVDVLTGTGQAVRDSFQIQTLTGDTAGTTGWVSRSLNLSAYAGQTVEIRFRLTVPQTYTGPANFALDTVSLTSAPTGTFTAQLNVLLASVTGVGRGTSLTTTVNKVISDLATGNLTGACRTLGHFVQKVNSQTGKTITATLAATLITQAATIETELGC